jgi:hypothetical protein
MSLRRLAAASALFVAGCGGDKLSQITPALLVSPSHLDFGTVELGQDAHQTVNLKNPKAVPAQVVTASVADDCGGCFFVTNKPDKVFAYVTYPLDVVFEAHRVQVATATLTITTDDPKAPMARVTMIGHGDDTRKPCIAVTPETINFGFVPAGGIAVSSFVVRSCGTNDLLIHRMTIDPPGAPFRITTATVSPAHPGDLPPGGEASVSLRAELPATATGTVTARILIDSNVVDVLNVPNQPGEVQVPITARANLPPLAVCGANQTIPPWSRATLDGSMSHDQDNPPDLPLVYRWLLTTRPGGSQTALERADQPNATFWADLTGHYEAQLVVTDGLGLESAPCVTAIDAMPTNAIRIELTWDHPDSDLDLHLIKGPNGIFCDCSTDCHYRDCGRMPNWFPSTPGANPRLDVDDRMGFGPENINIDGDGPMHTVVDGTYIIAVHYYTSNSQISTWPTKVSNATVRVFIFGLLAAELTHAMQTDGDLWFAGTINWPAMTVTPDGTVKTGQHCGAI